MKKSLITGVLAAGLACMASFATTVQAEEFAPAALAKFASVEAQVDSIRIDFLKSAYQAHDEQKAQSLEQEARAKIAKLLAAQGLKVAEYNAIASAAMTDPELRTRIAAIH